MGGQTADVQSVCAKLCEMNTEESSRHNESHPQEYTTY